MTDKPLKRPRDPAQLARRCGKPVLIGCGIWTWATGIVRGERGGDAIA
jgi:hypothetical protein